MVMSCTSALTYKNTSDRMIMRSFCIYKRKKTMSDKLNQLIELLKLEKIDDIGEFNSENFMKGLLEGLI